MPKATTHRRVLGAGQRPQAPAPLNVEQITALLDLVMEPCAGLPPRARCARWFERLHAHLQVLALLVEQRARASRSEEHRELAALTIAFIAAERAAGLPADAGAAYAKVRELARECRALLGLATDEPGVDQ
ncbi:DUF6415 family natural product biosynthesis protein [Streptomyces violascens]|uniref:DUF6415 family natural product biosynthesis protein n=1 Tax=Streptomyces violascens TaxID=67381 RepID=UPI0036A06004